jgi:hypothetical protein
VRYINVTNGVDVWAIWPNRDVWAIWPNRE